MNRYFTLLAIGLVSSTLISNTTAGVYKRVNPDGSVEFTDKPEEIGEKPIEVSPPSSYSPPPPPRPAAPAAATKKADVSYESVSISSPAHDATIRDNEGNISVSVSVKPGLQTGHSFILMMDGKEAGKGPQNSFQLKNVDRGSHNFSVQVIDGTGKIMVQSKSVTVHLHRATAKGIMKR